MFKNTDLRNRTKGFALRIVRMFKFLPKSVEAQVIGKQVLRSGTSVAANYREACRARSDAELISKLGIVVQALDESQLWLELLVESDIVPASKLADLTNECEELLKMTVTAIKNTKQKKQLP